MQKKHSYIPSVQEASVPEEGSWIEIETKWALALSIPDWEEAVGQRCTKGYQYTWMYDRIEKAYLFCFKLHDHMEKAIAFPRDHAGRLLTDERAQGEFSMVITSGNLTGDGSSYIHLEGIRFKQHVGEGVTDLCE